MKKSILLALALPLILASCGPTSTTQNNDGNGTESGSQTTGGTTTGGGTETGGETGGTETGGGTTGGDEEYTESTDKSTTQLGLNVGDKPTTIQFCDEITLTCGSGTNSNPPAFYSSELRFYINNTLTISNSKGKITDIKLRYTDSTGDNVNSFNSNVGEMTDYQTWKGSSSSVTFTVVNEEDGKTGHLKLASLKITYTSHLGGGITGGGTTGGGTTGGGTTGGGQTGGGTETGGQTETKTTTVSKSVGDFKLANGDKPQTLNVNEDVSLSLNKGSNTSNPPAYYTSDNTLRFYPGNILKVTSTKGSVTKIEFNYDGAGFSCSNGSLSNKVWTGSSSEISFTESGSKGNTKLYSIKITYGGTSGGGGTTGGGGGTETGGGGGGTTGGGGGTVTTTDYTSTWPSNYQQYVITYLNGAVPCFLNSNKKCLFNTIDTGTEESSGLPYFNPSIKNTSPGINYEYDYSVILHDAGFTDDGDDKDEGVTWHNYVKGNYLVRFAKYLSDDNIYVFDAYMFYDYYNNTTFAKSYTFQHDDKNLALASKYDSNNKIVNVNGWKITLTDIMKQSYWMQLKNNSGKIVIEGSVKGVFLEIRRNSNAAFVKAGTSSSTAKYIFNNGYRFDFPEGTKYVEISAQSAVLEFEFFEIGY